MKYRLNKFFAQKSYVASATEVIPINVKDPISQIVIKFAGLNVSYTPTAHLLDCVTKIEIVDGSDVLFSLNGKETEALDFYHNHGQLRCNWNRMFEGATPTRMLVINFGRYLWDREYAFDPTRFKNPQLRVTLAISAGGHACTPIYLTCFANIFEDEVLPLKGFMMVKQIKQHAVVAASHYYTDLPTDFPYRGLYYRLYAVDIEPTDLLSNLKLSENQDSRIPVDNTGLELLELLQQEYPPVRESYWAASATTGRHLYITPCQYVNAIGSTWSTEAQAQNPAFDRGEGGQLDTIQLADGLNIMVHVEGWLPHGVFEIPFGVKDEPTDWYDVRGIGSLRADMLGGDTGNATIFIQQVRAY